MIRTRVAILATLLAGLWWAAAPRPAAAAAGVSSCASGAVVAEVLHAPASVVAGSTFKVHVSIRNCTAAEQSGNLEGRLTAPAPCFAPVVDPLPLRLQPHQRFSTYYSLQATSCRGTYRVEVSVVQGSTVLADRTVGVRIT